MNDLQYINANEPTGFFVDQRTGYGPVRIFCPDKSAAELVKLFPQPVPQTPDGKFKVGDLVRLTDHYVDNVLQGLMSDQARAQIKGVRILAIYPELFPGCCPVDLEPPMDRCMTDSANIEKV